MLNTLTPNMMVENVNRTVEFYRDVLGFNFFMAVTKEGRETLMEMPQDKTLVYAMMKSGGVEVMFQEKESLYEDIPAFKGTDVGGSVSFYINVDDVKALFETLKDKTDVVKKLHTTWYGMNEFYIRDCNGYILGFSEQLQK